MKKGLAHLKYYVISSVTGLSLGEVPHATPESRLNINANLSVIL